MSDYHELLKRALSKKPTDTHTGERFVIPTATVTVHGSKTCIENFSEIASSLRRDPNHLLKFLLKELATKGEISGQRLLVQGIFTELVVNKKIELYVKTFVLCPECGKPDSKLSKEDKVTILRCEACGARHILPKL